MVLKHALHISDAFKILTEGVRTFQQKVSQYKFLLLISDYRVDFVGYWFCVYIFLCYIFCVYFKN